MKCLQTPVQVLDYLVFLHIQVNIRNNCPSLYTKVTFLREIICSPKMLFMLLLNAIYTENEIYTLKTFYSNFFGSFVFFRIEFILISFISLSVICRKRLVATL